MHQRIPLPIAFLFLIACICVASPTVFADEKATDHTTAEIRVQKVRPFSIPGVDGEPVELKEKPAANFTVVCFLGAECPLAKLYGTKLQRLREELQQNDKQRIRFIAVNSNRQDSIDDCQRYIDELKFKLPLGKDYKNVVADQFQATRTPEVFVIDNNLNVRYQGRIDDQYRPGLTKAKTGSNDLRDAIKQLLAGKQVTRPFVPPSGCLIGREKKAVTDSRITYTNDIAKVLQKHCVECHRAGDIGPFALTDYEEVSGWADMMVEVIDDRRMPPWHADPKHGDFRNARHMPESDKQLIRDWVKAGAPFGDPGKKIEQPEYASGWQLSRQPDQVVSMRTEAYEVPAEGTVEYQYFVADPGFEEDKWIAEAQILAGDRSVVHHAIAFIRPPDGGGFKGIGFLTAYVPGQRLFGFEKGYARKVPAKSKLVFQMHYTPNGAVAYDNTKLGLVFADEKQVSHEVYTLMAIDQEFEIPPNTPKHNVQAKVRYLPKDGELLSMAPHMHVRGRSFEIFTKAKDEKQILLNVPTYDFNWQHSYRLSKPLRLGDVDSLEFNATFDNSDNNPVNPDPAQHVTWGDQTWEEMAVAFFVVAEPRKKLVTKKTPDLKSLSKKPKLSAKKRQKMADAEKKSIEFAAKFIKRYDSNGDGEVHRDELPKSLSRFGWREIAADRDGNRRLSDEELRAAAFDRYLRK